MFFFLTLFMQNVLGYSPFADWLLLPTGGDRRHRRGRDFLEAVLQNRID
jgi:hypothetical protein